MLLNRVQRRQLLDAQFAALVDAALAAAPVAGPRSAPADRQRLRGIPMIGAAPGAIPGTVPHHNRRLDCWSGR